MFAGSLGRDAKAQSSLCSCRAEGAEQDPSAGKEERESITAQFFLPQKHLPGLQNRAELPANGKAPRAKGQCCHTAIPCSRSLAHLLFFGSVSPQKHLCFIALLVLPSSISADVCFPKPRTGSSPASAPSPCLLPLELCPCPRGDAPEQGNVPWGLAIAAAMDGWTDRARHRQAWTLLVVPIPCVGARVLAQAMLQVSRRGSALVMLADLLHLCSYETWKRSHAQELTH